MLAAAFVVARRDFGAILFSRSFVFFLLGPLFPVIVGALAGGVGQQVQQATERPQIGLAMRGPDVDAMLRAHRRLAPRMAGALPDMIVIARLAPGDPFDARKVLAGRHGNLAAIVSGSPEAPLLTGTAADIEEWRGPVSLVAGQALSPTLPVAPAVKLASTATSSADQRHGRVVTAQAGQTLMFLLTMLLAGMVLSNLVEEKGNKIIEILAAAIPLDALFLGKLFAMLAVSLVGIVVWGTVGAALIWGARQGFDSLPLPAVGWPAFFALGVVYFAMAYLLLGSVFLTIGSMAATVREVQTLSMPVTMLQLLVFFFASFAMTRTGEWIELAAAIVPFSSPFAMLARAAQDDAIWPHLVALVWQAVWVAVFVRGGAALFRKRVMKSGAASGRAAPRRWFARRGRAA